MPNKTPLARKLSKPEDGHYGPKTCSFSIANKHHHGESTSPSGITLLNIFTPPNGRIKSSQLLKQSVTPIHLIYS